MTNSPRCIHIQNDTCKYAYIGGQSGLRVIDISDKETPIITSKFYPGLIKSVFVKNDYVYIVQHPGIFKILSVENITKVIASLDFGSATSFSPNSLFIQNDYAYYSVESGTAERGIRIIDISNITNPRLSHSVIINSARGIFVQGNYVFVAAGSSGLKILRFGDILIQGSPSSSGVKCGNQTITIIGDVEKNTNTSFLLNFGVCYGHGQCALQYNNCTCQTFYYGESCEKWQCYKHWNYQPSTVCSSHGLCIDHNSCVCNKTFFGETCNITTCEGIWNNSTLVCNGRGNCSDYDTCTCFDGVLNTIGSYCECNNFYEGKECTDLRLRCFGVFADNASNPICKGHGKCNDTDLCLCDDFYFGDQCNITECKEDL